MVKSVGWTLLIGLLLIGTSEAMGPGFDCNKASTWSETYICQDAELASLDQVMGELYRTLQRSGSGRSQVPKATQWRWLRQRETCQHAEEPRTCLLTLYQQRIEELRNQGGSSKGSAKGMVLTPAVVWNHSEMVYRRCEIPDFDCVKRLMISSGASQEALDFLKREEAWVVEFTEYGNTDLLRLETFRANTNQFYALASVAAGVISAEGYDFSAEDKERREVKSVLSRHPEAFFIAKPEFVRHENGPNGGSRFVFRDDLADCRACEPFATGELIYEFDAAGRFLWVKLGDFKPVQ